MKKIYTDSSLLVSLLLGEPKSSAIQKWLLSFETMMSCHLLEAELFAVCAREQIDHDTLTMTLEHVSLYTPNLSLAKQYQTLFLKGYCRGPDAYHIACALYVDDQSGNIIFATADQHQGEIAKKVGLETVIF